MKLKILKNPGRILILGHTGFLGSGVYNHFLSKNWDVSGISRSNGFDLTDPSTLIDLSKEQSFDVVVNCAAHVGGIAYGLENQKSIFEDNLQMMINIFRFASEMGVYLVNPISNCAYPAELAEFKEESFWNGATDKSVQVYGEIRRLTLIASAAYRSNTSLRVLNICFPNLYGPGDHKDPKRAHALGALTNKFVTATRLESDEVVVWGSGKPVREWLFVDDAVNAITQCILLDIESELLNIGCGKGISIADLAEILKSRTGFKGQIIYDNTKPDGDSIKIMNSDISKEILDWSPPTSLQEGIQKTIAWYRQA